MFRVILAIAVTVMQGYVFWRASSVPFVKEHIPRRLLVGAGLALWASFFLGSAVSTDLPGVLAVPLERWSMTWLAMLFLTSVALLAVDVSTGFGSLMKRAVPRRKRRRNPGRHSTLSGCGRISPSMLLGFPSDISRGEDVSMQ